MNKIPLFDETLKNNSLKISPWAATLYTIVLALFSLPAYFIVDALGLGNFQTWGITYMFFIQFVMGISFVVIMQRNKGQIVELKITKKLSFLTVLYAFLFFVSCTLLADFLTDLIPTDGVLKKMYVLYEKEINDMFKNPTSGIVAACLLAPVLEEIFFRGLLLRGMLNYNEPPWVSILVSASLFGFSHVYIWPVVSAFILGIALAVIYYYTRALWLVVLLHFSNNALASVYFFNQENIDINSLTPPFNMLPIILIFSIPLFLYLFIKKSQIR